MKISPLIRIVLFLAILLTWLTISDSSFSFFINLFIVINGPICFTVISFIGNFLLKKFPDRVYYIDLVVHYSIVFILGITAVIALKNDSLWSKDFNFPDEISIFFILFFGIICFLTVLNLAISGSGAPFAISLTERISESFLYKYSRNPMVLSTICVLISIGLYYKSFFFILWTIGIIFPAFIVFLLVFEEKELFVRFGEKYMLYKQITPFFFPIPLKRLIIDYRLKKTS